MNNQKPFLSWLVKTLISWRLILLIFAFVGLNFLPFKESFPYSEIFLKPLGHPLFWSWGNFDGVHYLTIAQKGYVAQFTQAFFPLFPLTIRYLGHLINHFFLAGIIVSHLSLFLALIILYRLLRLDYSEKITRRILLFLLIFPTSFYFVSLYSESFFFLLLLLSFYAARKKHWWLAGISGALASATRLVGIFLLPALLFEWYQQHQEQLGKISFSVPKLWSKFKTALPILLISLGLLSYMFYLHKNFSDALYFLHSQPAFGASRSDKIILLYQVFFRYLKMILTVQPGSFVCFTVWQELLFSTIFLFLSLLAFKRTRQSYAIFGILSFIAPTLTGTFSSMPRYVLLLFPSFIVLSKIKSQTLRNIWLAANAILLVINTILFTRGYWVA